MLSIFSQLIFFFFLYRSLGLAIPPRIRFLQRMQKKMSTDNNIKTEHEETNKVSTDSADNSEQEDSGDSSDTNCIPNTTNSEKEPIKKEDPAPLQFGKKLKNVLLYYV